MQAAECTREKSFLNYDLRPASPFNDVVAQPSILGFIKEEGLNVLGRTLTTIGGGGQVLLGGGLCTTVVMCALGAPIAALGASNIQEGLTGQDGFARDGFQAAFGENGGDIAFGAVNLGTSITGLLRPVLRNSPSSLTRTPLFNRVPNDHVSAYTQATQVGLRSEAVISSYGIYDTFDRLKQ